MDKEKVYIDLKNKLTVDLNQKIILKDIGDVYCHNDKLKKGIENLTIYKTKNEEDWDYLTTIDLANKILEFNPKLDIDILGAPEIILEIKSKEPENIIIQFIKVFFVSVILFFGTAITIIYFHQDVNMTDSMNKIYYTLTGIKTSKPLVMTIPYSLGIGIGGLTFFNRVISRSRRRRKEPGPMEVEQYLFDQNMEKYILNSLKNKRNKEKKV